MEIAATPRTKNIEIIHHQIHEAHQMGKYAMKSTADRTTDVLTKAQLPTKLRGPAVVEKVPSPP